MVVLFPNATLRVRVHARPMQRDAHGVPITTGEPEWGPPKPGSVKDVGAGGQDENNAEPYSLRLDPSQWPLRPGDEVSDGEHTYVLTEAKLNTIAGMPNVPVAHVKATGLRRTPRVP